MTNLIIQVSKYLIIILMALYTLQCFTVFSRRDEESRQYLFLRQNMLMFFMHFVAFMVLYLEMAETTLLIFYGAQVIYLAAVLLLFTKLYPRASRLLVNNMCMLISIGFIMITRLSYSQSTKQFKIAVVASVVALLVPVLIRKLRFITKIYWLYVLVGIGLLALVAIAAQSTYGAKLSFNFGSFSIQPSEFVKIIYVFAIAGLLSHARDFKRIAVATGLAALHVLILVVSKDLGSALIFFATYLVMIFVSTRNPFYTLAGILAGSGAAVGAYFLFNHVRVRVQAWQDPFQDYQGGGYQICQSLFAISAGGWFGTGLCQGSPEAIPFVEQDFMFSAIAEELGSIFGICLLLVCMSCFVMFVNISMQLTNRFYRLVAVGLGTTYAVQIFLTVGGGIKLIPMTGVTLPLVSYGGSSMLSTLIMFSIVQGLYMLQRDEEIKDEEKNLRMAQDAAFTQGYQQQGGGYDPFYDTGYGQESYRNDGYGQQPYPDDPYEDDPYADQTYDEPGYMRDGYKEEYDEPPYGGDDSGNPGYGGYDGYDDGTKYDYYGEETYGAYGEEDEEDPYRQ
ncbi:MAG: FtsW/RodA/SpoVE family cell cycle protein [Lachnospiraceae bacterium]|uniref:FtsW/RodA/SpoVE family cell cycle protein n=1 Tax=Parablautia sp. Marseille-Q6255 TaxID=3039593 RepID=UPI0024BD49D1|nr:FtsW/RodA/SpoVE family cell cycle protein [Parablautia sp. Marseille-Q6255]